MSQSASREEWLAVLLDLAGGISLAFGSSHG
jgi:hypothetical protein